MYNSDVAIGGYQFALSGVNITDAYDTFDMIAFNWGNGMVLGTDLSGYDLPAGDGILLHVEFEAVDGGSTISLSELIIGDSSGGDEITSIAPDSVDIQPCWNYDGDSLADGYYEGTGNGGCDIYDPDDDNDGSADADDSDVKC